MNAYGSKIKTYQLEYWVGEALLRWLHGLNKCGPTGDSHGVQHVKKKLNSLNNNMQTFS